LGISADVTRITNAQSCACHASTDAASGNRGGDMKITSRRSKLTAWLAVTFGLVATVSAASAQDWYYINRQPASLDIAEVMAARGLPFGYYWLQPNGNWGFEGSSDVVGNIYGRRPSLSERGRLYGPGELLR
jgi:hypothetical protein